MSEAGHVRWMRPGWFGSVVIHDAYPSPYGWHHGRTRIGRFGIVHRHWVYGPPACMMCPTCPAPQPQPNQ